MDPKPWSSGPKVIVAGLVAGLMAGSLISCSNPRSPQIDLKKAKAALSKRRADYDDAPHIPPRKRQELPVRQK
jgi:hypothetical protein